MQRSIGELVQQAAGATSGARAWQAAADLSRHHRIQGSPGFREAALDLQRLLKGAGIRTRLLSYRADGGETSFWTRFLESAWSVREAWLDLLSSDGPAQRLADFAACATSLVQRSAPFHGEAQVVLPQGLGERPEDYADLDVLGKVVLTDGDVARVYRQAVAGRGAVGILYDGLRAAPPVRQPPDLPDARQYTSFWWGPDDTPRCFGFVLTPRQGQALRASLAQGQALRVRAHVASRLYKGAFHVLEAFLPGQGPDETVLVAHLCHPRPSANDNASGAAALLEAALALHRLLSEGVLPPLQRGIRFLWVPEMTGSYAYLATHEAEISQMVAGLNLDMVGESHEQCGSVFLIERPPDAAASWAPELLEWLRDDLLDPQARTFGLLGAPAFRHGVAGFSGGSDHYIFSDPTVGVPMPMLNQWPDRFYHTSLDTPDRVDPQMLGRAATLAAAYAAFIGTAEPAEVRWLGLETMARFRLRLTTAVQEGLTTALAAPAAEDLGHRWALLQRRLRYLEEVQVAALATLLRLEPALAQEVGAWQGEARAWCAQEGQRARAALAPHVAALGLPRLPPAPAADDPWEREAAGLAPRRLYRGPADHAWLQRALPAEAWGEFETLLEEHRPHAGALLSLSEYWADGDRTLQEVADQVEMESGMREVELLVRFYRLLAAAGLAELRRR
ncbi:MAG: DUF4910 domain-containing protein [Chloroflexi bacterium]|nr:DUF4910 domain-containing protein [Chloroflexota bacterium]